MYITFEIQNYNQFLDYSGENCKLNKKEDVYSGTKLKSLYFYFGMLLILGFVIGSLIIRHLIQKSMKNEYYRKSEQDLNSQT